MQTFFTIKGLNHVMILNTHKEALENHSLIDIANEFVGKVKHGRTTLGNSLKKTSLNSCKGYLFQHKQSSQFIPKKFCYNNMYIFIIIFSFLFIVLVLLYFFIVV